MYNIGTLGDKCEIEISRHAPIKSAKVALIIVYNFSDT